MSITAITLSTVLPSATWEIASKILKKIKSCSDYSQMQQAIEELNTELKLEKSFENVLKPEIAKLQKLLIDNKDDLNTISKGLDDLAHELVPKPTGWDDRSSRPVQLSMLLAGAWVPANQQDRDILDLLLRGSNDNNVNIESFCAELANGDNPFIERRMQAWTWTSMEDAWITFGRFLTETQLNNFKEAAVKVLSYKNPVYKTDPEERPIPCVSHTGPGYSKALRKGIAESLAYLVRYDAQLKNIYGDSKGINATKSVLYNVFENADWQHWASMSDVIDILAEASPDTFLESMEKPATQNGIAEELLKQESEWGPNPHTNYLWALEKLAWNKQYTSRVATLLAKMALIDPIETRTNHRPIKCLFNLLHFAMPQTCATSESRTTILVSLKTRYPEVAWKLMLMYLNATYGGAFFPSVRPKYLQWNLPEEPNVQSRNVQHKMLQNITDWALELVGNDAEKWTELINDVRLFNIFELRILDLLEKRKDEIKKEKEFESVGEALREALRMIYLQEDAENRYSDIIGRLERLCEYFQSDDTIKNSALLFTYYPKLPEKIDTDFREQEERISKLRKEELAKIIKGESAWENIKSLAKQSEHSEIVGTTLAEMKQTVKTEQIEQKLLDAYGTQDEYLKDALAGYIAAECHITGIEWFKSTIKQLRKKNVNDKDLIFYLTRIKPDLEYWKSIKELGEKISLQYWESIKDTIFCRKIKEVDYAVEKLFTVKRYGKALETVFFADHRRIDGIESYWILRGFKGLLENHDSEDTEGFIKQRSVGHRIDKLLGILDRDENLDPNEIIALEIQFFEFIEYSPKRKKQIHTSMENSPDLFVESLKHFYKDERKLEKDNDAEKGKEPDSTERARAHIAFSLLYRWKGYPGAGLNIKECEKRIKKWSEQALEMSEGIGRIRSGQEEVGKVLARVPAAEDKIWPCQAARELLENSKYDLADGLYLGIINARGVTVRDSFVGGKQERELAANYREHVEKLQDEYPQTAALLRKIANAFEAEADSEDAEVKAMQKESDIKE